MTKLFKKNRCLLIHPGFSPYSYWNFVEVSKIVGAKYQAAPLGLMIVATLLSSEWKIKLINTNVEPLLDEHFEWANLVFTGGIGFNENTVKFFWKMFFTVLLKNPKSIECGVNLSAMFIHFYKHSIFINNLANQQIDDINKYGEDLYNQNKLKMTEVKVANYSERKFMKSKSYKYRLFNHNTNNKK